MIVILYGGQRAGCCRFNLGRRSRSSTIQRFDVSLARRSLGVGDNDLTIAFAPAFLSLYRYAITG
jgi:hypothetical protein